MKMICPLEFQKNVFISSQDIKVAASATSIVSSAGTISNIIITNGGLDINPHQ
jgi:hypothetical protein